MQKTNTKQSATDNVIYFVYWLMLLLNKKMGILDAKGKATLLAQHKQLVTKKVQFVFEELHIHPQGDNKAFMTQTLQNSSGSAAGIGVMNTQT